MIAKSEEMSLIHKGNAVRIERVNHAGEISAIEMTEANLLSLLPLAQRECAEILEKQTTAALQAQGVAPIAPIQVRDIETGNDLHASEIYLSLNDFDGNHYRFAFGLQAAVRIAQRLLERVHDLSGGTIPTRQ